MTEYAYLAWADYLSHISDFIHLLVLSSTQFVVGRTQFYEPFYEKA